MLLGSDRDARRTSATHQPEADCHHEARALAVAGALRLDAAAVQLDDVPDDRQPEPEPAVRPRARAVGLAEAARRRTARTPARSRARCRSRSISTRAPLRPPATSTLPPRGVNLIALLSRFHTTCCSRSGSPSPGRRRIEASRATPDALGVGGGPHRFDAASMTVGSRPARRRAAACR